MAAFYSLLFLLSLTAGNLLLRSDAAAVDTVCRRTKQPRRCVALLKSSDTRTPTAALPVLGEIAITAALDAAGKVRSEVGKLLVGARDPKLKRVYTNCDNLYRPALDQLLISPEYLQKRSYGKLAAVAGVVSRSSRGCAAAVGKNGGLRTKNEDTEILAEAITVIAKSLARIQY